MADTNASLPLLPAHIEETIRSIARLHARHYQNATPLQRVVDRTTALLGRPRSIGVLMWKSWPFGQPPQYKLLKDVVGAWGISRARGLLCLAEAEWPFLTEYDRELTGSFRPAASVSRPSPPLSREMPFLHSGLRLGGTFKTVLESKVKFKSFACRQVRAQIRGALDGGYSRSKACSRASPGSTAWAGG